MLKLTTKVDLGLTLRLFTCTKQERLTAGLSSLVERKIWCGQVNSQRPSTQNGKIWRAVSPFAHFGVRQAFLPAPDLDSLPSYGLATSES